ncbi:mitotic spindle assembly checkpoint protein MAD1 [Neoarius graeffei]|uniref:mitotic spindle assembly checkpoint protein MAD1 n=1 Tax=Neoarius graeffei TaxID=443677 RepID=UPI00298BD23E|nr:mitotic spindle assembly checkpoint protein MAD1 [Neoarius graeffei]XP_060754558.1 mitotic spindle assembly checkpoint protein MAD1 [Neoarius graeffei]XP_060754559.1 mitotic spindle assembly checkpoint protein MAD1 [Neoarius graeffei]XP_060754560.1 mitotic spindle assembly checkpoint protein MAD1 [Neoarius graeffei]XP_060754561.1 mitotic spindle assembly checkpoint protein MAD1 [Neoarius graeffei]
MSDLEDDTIIFSTLKSFKSLISRPDCSLPEPESAYGRSDLQKLYMQRVEMEEAAERIHSKTSLLQLTQEKQQMELSHKRARIELEKEAHNSSRDLQRQVDQNQDLLMKIRRLEEKEEKTLQALSEQLENNKSLKRNIEELQKQARDKDGKLSETNQMMNELRDEIRTLNQKLQIQESKFSTQSLEKQALEEQLEMQQKKYQEVNQKYQNLQMSHVSNTESEIKIKELKRRLELQEQDSIIVKNMKTEVTRLPELKREIKHLQEENAYLREMQENSSLLKEETDGLRRKLERMEKVLEEKLKLELEKEKLTENLQAWENIGQTTSLNIRKPEDLSREVMQIQQRELSLKQHNCTLSSNVRKLEKTLVQLQSETAEFRAKALEEQKKRENQDALVRRLQKRVLLLTKERDGMRAILESYDSELAASEYSPQLSRRVKEAEEMLHKVQSHNSEMEIQLCKAQEEAGTFKLQAQQVAEELKALKEQKSSVSEASPIATEEEIKFLRQKIEELESERQKLEEQNHVLKMRLERHNLQGDYDPVKTKVLHFRLNPTSVAKQERAEEVEQLKVECERLRERLRKMEAGGAITSDDTTLIIPPSQEILDLRKQLESAKLKNQRLKEVFQKKIQEFRTACYVLTGYQIDMTVENQYRLTSVYAERMEDSLLFKASGAVGSGSMQLLETDFSRTLTELVDLHLFHQKSIPVFLSAVTLDLFSRQTVV